MSGFSCTSCICFNKCKAICHWDLRVGANSRNETRERGKRWTVYPPEVPFFLFILIRSAFLPSPKQTKGMWGEFLEKKRGFAWLFFQKSPDINYEKRPLRKNTMVFLEAQKSKQKYAKAPMKDDSWFLMVPFSPSGHDSFRWCGNSSQTTRFAQNFTLQSEKLQPTFEPQNHENEALNIWVITPNNEGNVGSHGTTTLFLGKGISLGTVDLVLWQ